MHEPVTDPLRARAEAAVRTYRQTGERRHLDQLTQDGQPGLAHDLVMESVHRASPEDAAPYTERIEAWLAGGSGR